MKPARILLIEDDDLVRESISDLLMLADYDVTTAVNGKEGLEIIQTQVPELIICDVMMPVMDGFQLLEKLKELDIIDSTYFMFLSAKSRESDLEKGKEMGAHDYLIKPFRNEDLLNKVKSIL
jgi:DNA-binding response OmpR family regulator